MSRLEFLSTRMVSQRACIDHAAALTQTLTGPVFELGLGNDGRFTTSAKRLPEAR